MAQGAFGIEAELVRDWARRGLAGALDLAVQRRT